MTGIEGAILFPVFIRENTHNVVPVEKCMIEDQKADEIIGTIRGMLKSFKIRTFDEDTGYGLLRHVLIRRGFESGEIMVVLVTASPVFPSKNNFVKALREKHPEITTIVQNINGRGTSMVLGEKEHVLYGKGYIVDTLCGCSFRISSRSFLSGKSGPDGEIVYKGSGAGWTDWKRDGCGCVLWYRNYWYYCKQKGRKCDRRGIKPGCSPGCHQQRQNEPDIQYPFLLQ